MKQTLQSILVIRRDNIGDLVCTTPVIAALRQHFPKAWIGALVNDYTRTVLEGNPDLDEVFSYQKAKHRTDRTVLRIYWQRLRMLLNLRRKRIDCIVLASPGYQASAERLARFIKARQVVGFDSGTGLANLSVPLNTGVPMHQVENAFRVLGPLGIYGPPPPLKLVPDASKVAACKAMLPDHTGPVVGVHISARESDRRWPDANFTELIARLIDDRGASVVLTWAPGARDRRDFPGDDDSARQLAQSKPGGRLLAIPTSGLSDLIASLAVCDYIICSDGGPVHLAAALGKPVVCFFGSERPELWHPWSVPYRLLQPASRNVADITVAEALSAFSALADKA